jgi:hypothetical protein
VRPTFAQLRFLQSVAKLAADGPVRLGDALTAAGVPTIQRRTVDACRRYGWVARHDGPPPTWDLTEGGREAVASA